MAVRRQLPSEDHVLRYVPKSRQHRDPDTDEFLGITSAAMQLREDDQGGLSVTWVEHYGNYDLAGLRKAATAFKNSQPSKKLGAQAVFAAAQVEAISVACLSFGKRIRVVHDPVPDNPGHAEIRHFSDEDSILLEFLASDVFSQVVLVSELGLPK